MPIGITLPTVGGSTNTWGTTLNTALNQLNGYDVFTRKTSAQSVTSSVAKVDDSQLAGMTLVASAVYIVQWSLRVDGATAGDFRYAWAYSGTGTMTWVSTGLDVNATTVVNQPYVPQDVALIGTDVIHGTVPTTAVSPVDGSGLVATTTGGTFKLQWAQGTSSVTATRILADSWVLCHRVA